MYVTSENFSSQKIKKTNQLHSEGKALRAINQLRTNIPRFLKIKCYDLIDKAWHSLFNVSIYFPRYRKQ